MLGRTILSLQGEIGQKSLFLLLQHSWQNQLASDGPESIKPVVIPALTTVATFQSGRWVRFVWPVQNV